MWKFISAIFWSVFPTKEQFETDRFFSWRVSMAALALFGAGMATMNYAIAFGFVTVFGFSGFAQASEVSDLIKQQQAQFAQLDKRGNDIMLTVLAGQISDIHFKQCAALKASNNDTYWALQDELQSKMDAYQSIQGRRYLLPACP